MVWDGRDQAHWWKPTDTVGAKVLLGGKWQSIDWCDNTHIEAILDGVKKAGIQVVVADLTNGWAWLDERCRFMQEVCARKGLRFCVAENSNGDVARFDAHAKDIWDHFAGPSAAHRETYLRYHGKPLIVCYGIREWVNAYRSSAGPWRSRFSLVWASGEDSDADKWGWQLEPWVASLPSRDSMFITSAIKWPGTDEVLWRKSLAWLDYNFALAKKSRPDFVIVGSYDDIWERNSWMPADTSGCLPGRQMRDPFGRISVDAYYDRVKQWIAGKPRTMPGGAVRDGCYRIESVSTDRLLSARGEVGARLSLSSVSKNLDDFFWFYHLGKDRYRIIALSAGLSVSGASGKAELAWDDDVPSQTWSVKRVGRGLFAITNRATGVALNAPDDTMTPTFEWRLVPVLTL
jgi:hypothetical protein